MSDTKATSETSAWDIVSAGINLSKLVMQGKLKDFDRNKLRTIYDAALKTPGSRELSVEEAEQFIRPYELASDTLKSEIENPSRSSEA